LNYLLALLILLSPLFASNIYEEKWPKKETFLGFLERERVPLKLYYNLEEEQQEDVTMIFAGMDYHLLKDDDGVLLQALIPLTENTQISIHQVGTDYKINFVPISFDEIEESISFELENSLLQDLHAITGNSKLALELSGIFNDSIDFRRDLRKGDRISIIYKRKIRLGKTWGLPSIEAAFIETNKRRHYAFWSERQQGFFDDKGRSIQGMFLRYPVKFSRISSRFTYKRYHPVLKRNKPHLGVDYVAPIGTPIKAVSHGKVIFAGRKGASGRLVVLQHKNGFLTKYAHLKGIARKTRRGAYVKQGDTIGYLGNTGRSTGPHLHFALYKNGRAMNPSKIKNFKKGGLGGKSKRTYLANINTRFEQLKFLGDNQSQSVIRIADLNLAQEEIAY
jgi:murein DD-endopeptidase MepM/ murein hydrolase activator NlpD